ncbi:MAG: phage tail tube protein [Pseudomonadota bacterium]
MTLLKQRCQIACEIEAEEGTVETLEGVDVFLAFNPRFKPNIEAHERDPVRSSLSPHPSVFGKRSATLGFDVELVGGTAGAAIHYSDALKACGVGETLVTVTSATYKPASASVPSVTLGMYMDGKSYTVRGARGTAKLLLEAGKPGILSMDFTGADFTEADTALLTTGVSLSAVIPPAFQGATLTIDAYAATISKLEIDLGNTIALREDANSTSGHKSAAITNRRPKMSFDPENALVASEDYLGNWRSGALMALSTVMGTGAGNVITITAPKVQYQDVSMVDRDGISVFEISGLLCLNAGDDEWSIAIT